MSHRLMMIAAAGLCAWGASAPAAKPAPGGARPMPGTPVTLPPGVTLPAGVTLPPSLTLPPAKTPPATTPPAPPPTGGTARPAPSLTNLPAGLASQAGQLCALLDHLPTDRPALPADKARLLGTLGAECAALNPPRRSSAADAPDDLDQ